MGCALSENGSLCAGMLIPMLYRTASDYSHYQCVNANEILNSPAICFAKVAILLQYKRIFVPQKD